MALVSAFSSSISGVFMSQIFSGLCVELGVSNLGCPIYMFLIGTIIFISFRSSSLCIDWIGIDYTEDESGKISKQLAEQRALVATLEVEVSTVLQEKSILESVYREHVQQYVIVDVFLSFTIWYFHVYKKYTYLLPSHAEKSHPLKASYS